MKRVGLLLVSVAFLAVSVILVLDEREVSWLPYGLVLFFGAIGIVCIRLGDRAQAQREDLQTADVETLRSSLARVVEEATRLEAEKSEIGVYDLRVRIDERFRSDLEVFVDAREVLTHVYGLQAYAEVMSLFAAGERSLNRVWSASTDGYIDEAMSYISRALSQFTDAKSVLEGLSSAAPADQGGER